MHRFVIALLFMLTIALPVAAQQNRTHTVQPGDSLTKIAQQYNTTADAIATANRIVNPNLIYRGQVLVIPSAGTTPPVSQPSYGSFNYTIVYGDTLSTIADRYGTTVQAILDANTWYRRTDMLRAGQVFVIPAGNTQPTPRPGTGGIGGTGRWYVVRPGDTMFRIAAAYRVNVYDLAEANGILNLNLIYSGQSLRIPGR